MNSYLKMTRAEKGLRFAFYPGSFDPFHAGHLSAVKYVLENDLVERVFLYVIPCDGKRKTSKSQDLREKILLDALASETLFIEHKIVLLRGDVHGLRQKLKTFEGCVWTGIIGNDNGVFSNPDLGTRYMVRQEFDPVPNICDPSQNSLTREANIPLDVLASSAVTVSSFIMFSRQTSDQKKSEVSVCSFVPYSSSLGKRHLLCVAGYGNESVNSTAIRKALKKLGTLGILSGGDLNLLKEYL